VNRQCNVTKRIQTSKGPRYCPVVLSANGRIKPDLVLVGDREERHPEGAYYISWYEGKRLIRLSVGKDAATATARRLQKEAELNAVNNGVAIAPNGQNGRRRVNSGSCGFFSPGLHRCPTWAVWDRNRFQHSTRRSVLPYGWPTILRDRHGTYSPRTLQANRLAGYGKIGRTRAEGRALSW
jgi:hypothetical protein